MTNRPLRLGIAGLGTVGSGTIKLLTEQAGLIEERCGVPLTVAAISAKNRNRKRDIDVSAYVFYEDACALAHDSDVDIVVELIGGEGGIALALSEQALSAKKHLVTANKAMLAHHGFSLAKLAEDHGVELAYEAAVAGGIPIVKGMREGLAGNQISMLYGILNGTCNYILTKMLETGRSFEDVLAEAQELGYAEADPGVDVDGVDAAHKLALLASLAFGGKPCFDAISMEGIRQISATDMAFAQELGYRIKLLGIARLTDQGLEQRLHPCMVPLSAPIAHIDDVFNAVVAEGHAVGKVLFDGRGAGSGPTASAVVADLIDIARGHRLPVFGKRAAYLKDYPIASIDNHRGRYYVRLEVRDEPGVLTEVASAMSKAGVSIERFRQDAHDPDEPVSIYFTTHETVEKQMRLGLDAIGGLPFVFGKPNMIRIEHI